MRYRLFFLSTALAAIMVIDPAMALQGSLGHSSSGEVHLTLIKPEVASISGLSDMSVPLDHAEDAVTWTSNACVYSTGSGYTVAAIGSVHDNGAFVMSDGGKSLPYHVAWADGDPKNPVPLAPGVPSPMQSAGTACRGHAPGASAGLVISVPAGSFDVAQNNSFKDSLTLLIAPN